MGVGDSSWGVCPPLDSKGFPLRKGMMRLLLAGSGLVAARIELGREEGAAKGGAGISLALCLSLSICLSVCLSLIFFFLSFFPRCLSTALLQLLEKVECR